MDDKSGEHTVNAPDAIEERVALVVYGAMTKAAETKQQPLPWVNGGNSDMQECARHSARIILSVCEAVSDDERFRSDIVPRERLEEVIEEQRVEILGLSAFTKLARDAVNMLNDETSEVVVTRLLAELDAMRTVTDAQCDAIISQLDTYALAWEGKLFGTRASSCMGLPIGCKTGYAKMRAIIRAALARTEAKI